MPQCPAKVTVIGNIFTSSSDADYNALLHTTWAQMPQNGLLVLYEDLSTQPERINGLEQSLADLGEPDYYSLIAGCKIKHDYEISQYSLAVEENLRQEKNSKDNVVRVLQKS